MKRYIERMGTGIGDMLRISKETGLRQPEFEITDGFTARIWRKGVPKTGKKGSGKGSGKTRDLIVELMRENPDITIPEIAEILGKKTRTIEKHIHKLKSEGVIQRIGPAKGGRWKVLE